MNGKPTIFSDTYEISIIPLMKNSKKEAIEVLSDAYSDEWRFKKMFGEISSKSRVEIAVNFFHIQYEVISSWEEHSNFVATCHGKLVGAIMMSPPQQIEFKYSLFQKLKGIFFFYKFFLIFFNFF